ncbi:MAG TPA: hypothetical protein VH814_25050 [Steroidobacteraceae bacterium]|jgi:uncharacterized membrane protein
MPRRSLAGVILVLALCVCSLPAAAKQPTTYRLALIFSLVFDPIHDQKEIRLGGLNDKGEVAMSVGDNGAFSSFVWHDGAIQEVGSVILLGIDDRSRVVGMDISGPDHAAAVAWRDGQLVFLQARSGERLIAAADINNRGQIIVRYLDAQGDGQHGVWRRGVLARLDAPPGFSGIFAARISNRGDVAGFGFSDRNLPLLWKDDTVMQIDIPPGADEAFGNDINDHGTVIANASFAAKVGESFGHVTAYVWKDGEITLLPALTSEQQNSSAGSINNRGVVVGISVTNPGQTFRADATIWHRGLAADLNDLISDEDPLEPFVHLASAERINNRGQIVAIGQDSRRPDTSASNSINYYLLTPEH